MEDHPTTYNTNMERKKVELLLGFGEKLGNPRMRKGRIIERWKATRLTSVLDLNYVNLSL
jgi:hypothetical protein